jgi:hypothetical protein
MFTNSAMDAEPGRIFFAARNLTYGEIMSGISRGKRD